jgi:mono/diheme cytochrome c family protein
MRLGLPNFTRLNALTCAATSLFLVGCNHIPGRPGPGPEVKRPDQVLDFPTLYRQNCAGCHGENGKNGATIPLANPVYLAVAGEATLLNTIAKGVPGKLMPPFAKSFGGMLTDQQVDILAGGILRTWSTANLVAAQSLPPYLATLSGDSSRGKEAFTVFCARCHGAAGEGAKGDPKTGSGKLGSIVDPSYLALISDQNLRSIIIAGLPDRGMPDWRTDAEQLLTDQQLTDVSAWLASQRTANPGQPYPTHP